MKERVPEVAELLRFMATPRACCCYASSRKVK
jgi:hypothetical protein